jgi:hypothetical protein
MRLARPGLLAGKYWGVEYVKLNGNRATFWAASPRQLVSTLMRDGMNRHSLNVKQITRLFEEDYS